MNLLQGFIIAWYNLMNLFDADIPNLTNQINISGGV